MKLFQVDLSAGCPQASKIQPRNEEDFASARAKAHNLLCAVGQNAVGRRAKSIIELLNK